MSDIEQKDMAKLEIQQRQLLAVVNLRGEHPISAKQ